MESEVIAKAIKKRNVLWQGAKIPKWVDIESVALDQFYTNTEVAYFCYMSAIDYLKANGVNLDECFFVEPSAGNGVFLDFLPKNSRIGLDICPMRQDIIEADFLTWEPKLPRDKKIIYIGNPPFGYRGWLALQFMNKCGLNADYAFFILPMSFQSMGKGSPRFRVEGLTLKKYERLPKSSFHTLDGKKESINALWTIWEKGENLLPKTEDLSSYLELFTVDMRKERLCGMEKMSEAAFFLQRTFYDGNPPHPVENFADVKYVCGYGFIPKQKTNAIKKILDNTDWFQYSNLAAHNCHHISMYHIKQALTDGGIKNV